MVERVEFELSVPVSKLADDSFRRQLQHNDESQFGCAGQSWLVAPIRVESRRLVEEYAESAKSLWRRRQHGFHHCEVHVVWGLTIHPP